VVRLRKASRKPRRIQAVLKGAAGELISGRRQVRRGRDGPTLHLRLFGITVDIRYGREHTRPMPKNLRKYLLRGGLVVLCGTIFNAPPASASPILWNLVGVSFNDGETASGSFAYDAATNTYSSVNITTTTGNRVAGATYLFLDPAFVLNAVNLIVVPNAGPYDHFTPILFLAFNPPLMASGGTVSILFEDSVEGTCNGPGCSALNFQGTPLRFVSAGSVSTVPEPSSFSLVFAAAFALCLGSLVRNGRSLTLPFPLTRLP
jgi:hypothetical protein